MTTKQTHTVRLVQLRKDAAKITASGVGPTPPNMVDRLHSQSSAAAMGVNYVAGREDGDTRQSSGLPIQIYYRVQHRPEGWQRGPDCYNAAQVASSFVALGLSAVAVTAP